MITIEIGNSYSVIKGLTPAQERAIRGELSFQIDPRVAYFSKSFPKQRSLLSKKGEFPTGLVSRVLLYLNTNRLEHSIEDLRIVPIRQTSLEQTGHEPYVAQKLAVAAARHWGRGTISMPTGTGKSQVISMICSDFNQKTLVVVPSLEIKKQMQEILKHNPNVTIENIDSKALNKPQKYDMLIIDEAHHVAAKTYQKLNRTAWKDIYYRFFLTATPFRNNKNETLLFEAIAGELIYELTYKEAIKQGYIVPVEAYYYEVPKTQPEGFTWAQVYSELVVNNRTRNEIIAITLLRLQEASKSTLCLVQEVAHGKALAAITGLPFVSGSDAESRGYIQQFNSGEIKVLIATSGIMGEGLDTKPCSFIVIAGLGKAKSRFMQQVGRSLRKFPGKESGSVILFLDRSHKWTKSHFAQQKQILKDEYGIVPIKLEL